MRRRNVLLLGAAAMAATGTWTATAYRRALAEAAAQIEGRSRTAGTSKGIIEYAMEGSGPLCLMIHGTGGGFDQGLFFARPLIAKGWTVLAPSRFGYLRSSFPAEPTLENQADVLAELLDALKIERVPVIAGSAGALTALQFALRHPERCTGLVTLVPATYVPGRPPVRPSPIGQAIMTYGLQSDFLFWSGMQLAEDRMISTLLATDPAMFHAASPDEQTRARAILHGILPVSLRSKGLINDGLQAGTPEPMPIERITVPTLAISCEDDRFGTAAAARHISATVPGAKLSIYPSGGHIYIGHEDEIFSEIDVFLRPTT